MNLLALLFLNLVLATTAAPNSRADGDPSCVKRSQLEWEHWTLLRRNEDLEKVDLPGIARSIRDALQGEHAFAKQVERLRELHAERWSARLSGRPSAKMRRLDKRIEEAEKMLNDELHRIKWRLPVPQHCFQKKWDYAPLGFECKRIIGSKIESKLVFEPERGFAPAVEMRVDDPYIFRSAAQSVRGVIEHSGVLPLDSSAPYEKQEEIATYGHNGATFTMDELRLRRMDDFVGKAGPACDPADSPQVVQPGQPTRRDSFFPAQSTSQTPDGVPAGDAK